MRKHFWLEVARLKGRVYLQTKTSLNCTMPALTNMSVGSFAGTSGELATTWCCLDSKKSRKARRTSADVRRGDMTRVLLARSGAISWGAGPYRDATIRP